MKKNTAKDYAVALYEMIKDLKGEKLYQAISGFAEFLVKKNKLKKAPKIIEEFVAYAKGQEGIVEIEITSARHLSDKVVKEIESNFGANVETTKKINADLIGGVCVKTSDKIFDGSARTQLLKLKSSLQ